MPPKKRAKKSRKAIVSHKKKTLHNGVLKIVRRVLDVPRGDGSMMEGVTREILRRADSAAALVHDTERNTVLLAEVWRAPAYDRGEAGWLREIVAGTIERDETPEACIRREMLEEIGIRAPTLEPVATAYASPGYSTERIHVFYAPIRTRDLIDPEARGIDAGEDVVRVWVSLADFFTALPACADSKTMLAGLWLKDRFARAAKNDV